MASCNERSQDSDHPHEEERGGLREDQLAAALDEYFQLRKRGVPFDREAFLERHADHREELSSFIDTEALVEEAAGGLGDAEPTKPKSLLGYEILDELGRGATGIVYRARRPGTECPRIGRSGTEGFVALKVVELSRFEKPRARQRIIESSRAAERLHHPNIVKLLEHGESDSGLYSIAMEYVDGETLEQALVEQASSGEAFDLRRAVSLAKTIAEAVHHAHTQGVVHRDLKPSNVMLERSGRVVITDFGLAKSLADDSGATLTGEVVGTPRYMSPEQAAASRDKLGPLSDLYAIGAILYELLVGRPVFEDRDRDVVLRKVRDAAPTRLTTIRDGLPEEFETICMRCLEKEPRDRWYASAGELAEDLGRWLLGEPVRARPAGKVEKAWRWCRGHPASAGLIAAGAALVVSLAVAAFFYTQLKANESLRNAGQLVAYVVRSERSSGWRKGMSEWLPDLPGVPWVRDLATAALIGIDARETLDQGQRKQAGDSSAVAFWGDRLLLASPGGGAAPTRIWNPSTGEIKPASIARQGPLAVRENGVPVQLVHESGDTFVLWDLSQDRVLLNLEGGLGEAAQPFQLKAILGPVLAMTPTARVGGALLEAAQGGRVAILWDLSAGARIAAIDASAKAVSLAISPDGGAFAVGTEDGQIELRSVSEGKAAGFSLGEPAAGQALAVVAMAFGRSPFRPRDGHGKPPGLPWLLAAGLEGGVVKVWDLGAGALVSTCRGSWHWVNGVAFSPDGMTLATGGKYDVLVWDVATGTQLLKLAAGSNIVGVAFSPEGTRLAATMVPTGTDQGLPRVWALETGRGIKALRGLAAPVASALFSRDGKLVAALASDWTVGVWDLERERLLHVLVLPAGTSMDNASVAIDPSGRQLAASSGRSATVWDLDAGRLSWTCPLPSGFADRIAFHPSGALVLLRRGPMQVEGSPAGASKGCDTLRLERVTSEGPRLIRQIPGFFREECGTAVAPDGGVFFARGFEDGPSGRRHVVVALDALTGEALWSRALGQVGRLWAVDPTGSRVLVSLDSGGERAGTKAPLSVLDAATGEEVDAVPWSTRCIGPSGDYRVGMPPEVDEKVVSVYRGVYQLYRKGSAQPIVTLGDVQDLMKPQATAPAEGSRVTDYVGVWSALLTYEMQFSRDGRLFAVGTQDCRVRVYDIKEVERRLEELGL